MLLSPRPVALLTSPFFAIPLLLALGSFLFFYHLAGRDLWSSHEGRAAQDAQSILLTGNWGMARLFDGHLELQKPPLYYWLVAAVGWLQGGQVDAWAVRLPSALSALVGVLVLYIFLWRRGRPLAAFFAAVILATTLHYTWLARVGRIDMPLTVMVGLALGCFYLARSHAGQAAFTFRLLAYLAIAVAVMLKGPIGALLPAVVLGVHAFLSGDWPLPWRPGFASGLARSSLCWGVLLVLALTLPWYWWAYHETQGDFFRVFFWHHNIERGLGGSEDLHGRPWWLYFPYLFWGSLPWSPFLLAAICYFCRRGRWRDDPEARFGLVWLASIVLLLSCFQFKRSDYLLPAFPGAALFLACVYETWRKEKRSGANSWVPGSASLNFNSPPYEGGARVGGSGAGCITPPYPPFVRGGAENGWLCLDESAGETATTSEHRSPHAPRDAPHAEREGYDVPGNEKAWILLTLAFCLLPLGWWVYLDYVLPRKEAEREHRTFAREVRRLVPEPQFVLFFRAEAHPLAFHLGGTLNTFLEWENLDIWAGRPGTHYIIMPPECARDWPKYVTSGRLEEVLRNTDLTGGQHEHPLVLMRTMPKASPPNVARCTVPVHPARQARWRGGVHVHICWCRK